MSSHIFSNPLGRGDLDTRDEGLRWFAPVGRLLFAAIFLLSAPLHFTAKDIAYAASQGVPIPEILVPLSGVIALLGGLSVLIGYEARIGAILLALFLIPVTLMMHRFWALDDPMQAQMQMAMFMKNLALLGTTSLIGYFGAGPISLDAKRGSLLERRLRRHV